MNKKTLLKSLNNAVPLCYQGGESVTKARKRQESFGTPKKWK